MFNFFFVVIHSIINSELSECKDGVALCFGKGIYMSMDGKCITW